MFVVGCALWEIKSLWFFPMKMMETCLHWRTLPRQDSFLSHSNHVAKLTDMAETSKGLRYFNKYRMILAIITIALLARLLLVQPELAGSVYFWSGLLLVILIGAGMWELRKRTERTRNKEDPQQ